MFLDINFQSGEFYGQQSAWQIVPPYISALASLATLVLAILIFRNQDANKVFIKNRVEKVVEFINTLNDAFIHIEYRNPANSQMIGLITTLNFNELEPMINDKNSNINNYRNIPVIFETDFYLYSPLLKYKTDFFIPKAIREEINKLLDYEYRHLANLDDYEENGYVKIGQMRIKNQTERKRLSMTDGTHTLIKTYLEFVNQLLKIKSEAEKHLRSNNIKE